MLELFSALLFAVRFQHGAGSIPEVRYTIASHSFSQRASLILPHSEGELSDWNMLPARVTQTVTSLSRRRHFVVVWASVLPAGRWNAKKNPSWCCAAPQRATPTASDVSPEVYYIFLLLINSQTFFQMLLEEMRSQSFIIAAWVLSAFNDQIRKERWRRLYLS